MLRIKWKFYLTEPWEAIRPVRFINQRIPTRNIRNRKSRWSRTVLSIHYFKIILFRWYVAMNLLKGGGARYVFPCFEKPNLKTWIELSVAHKGDFHVLTTMPLIDTTNVYV